MTASAASATFDIGRVIGRTFGVIGRNFVVFVALTLLLRAIPTAALTYLQLSTGLAAPGSEPGTLPNLGGVGMWLLGGVVSIVTAYVLQAALVRGTIADLSGKKASIGELLATGFKHFLPLFGLAIVMGLCIGVGFLLLLVPGIILACRWIAAVPVLVVEDKGVSESMGRSAALTKGYRWSIFGLLVIYTILSWIVAAVLVGALLGALGGFSTLDAAGMQSTPMVIFQTVLQAVLGSLVSLVGAAGAASVYYELRTIKEGVGVEALARVFD